MARLLIHRGGKHLADELQIIPIFSNEALCVEKEEWKASFLAFVSVCLEELLNAFFKDKYSDITSTIFN